MRSTFLIFLICINLGQKVPLGAATLGDRILEERYERMQAAADRDNPLRGIRVPTSLENLENIGGGVQLVSEDSNGISLTLLEAVRVALEKNPSLVSQTHRLKASQELSIARPTARKLFADFRTGLNLANNLDNDPRSFQNRRLFDVSHQENSLYFGLDLRFPLLDGGKSSALMAQGTLEEQLEKVRSKKYRQEVLMEVAKTYVEMILLDEKLRLSDLVIEKNRYETTEEQRKPNQDPNFPVNLLKARMKLDVALQERIDLSASKRLAISKFRSLLGWKSDQKFQLDRNARTRLIRESKEALLDAAIKNSPRLNELKILQKIKDQKRRALHANKELSLDLMGKTEYTKLVESQGVDEIRYLIGFELKTNITDSRTTLHMMNSNREEKLALARLQEEAQTMAQAELNTAYEYYLDFKKRISAHLDNAKLARRVQMEAEDRLRGGIISKLNLMDHRIQYQKALLAYYEALTNLIHAKLKIFELSGMLDEEAFG